MCVNNGRDLDRIQGISFHGVEPQEHHIPKLVYPYNHTNVGHMAHDQHGGQSFQFSGGMGFLRVPNLEHLPHGWSIFLDAHKTATFLRHSGNNSSYLQH